MVDRRPAFGSISWLTWGLLTYLGVAILTVTVVSVITSWQADGFGALTSTLFALVLLVPVSAALGVVTMLVLRLLLPRVRRERMRAAAIGGSFAVHLAVMLLIAQPWTAAFEPSLPAILTALTYGAPPAAALGLTIGLPRDNIGLGQQGPARVDSPEL